MDTIYDKTRHNRVGEVMAPSTNAHKLIDEVGGQDICVGASPKSNILMSWTPSGELAPVTSECCGEDVCVGCL